MANFLSNLSPDWFNSVMGNPGAPTAPAPYAEAPITQAPDVQNMLQNLNTGAIANDAPATSTDAPRPRRSILDTIGRLADVFAKVGGADALYQPTLDAREDRSLALGDHAQQVDLNKLKLATAQNTLDDAGRARLAQAVRGTQALLAANPQADISKIFPLLAARAGVDPAQATALAGQIAANPSLLDGLAGFDDSGDKYGGSVVYAKGPDGKIVAFQPNLKGGKGRAILPDGFTAVDPLKIVDTGGAQVAIDPRTGQTVTTLAKGQTPDSIAGNATKRDIAAGNNRTAITVAGMPARAKAGGAAGKPVDNSQAVFALRGLDASLADLAADPRLGGIAGATGLIGGRMNITSEQRAIKGKIDSIVGQAIPAAIAAIKSSGGASPRAVSEIMGEVKGLTGAIQNRDMDTADYIKSVNAARIRLQSRIRELQATPPRTLPPRIGAAPPARRTAGKPSVSNW